MGLLDGILGNVLGGNRAQPQTQDPLGAILSGLSDAAAKRRAGRRARQVPPSRYGRAGRLVGEYGTKHEHLIGSAPRSIRFRRSQRYRFQTRHVRRSSWLGDVASSSRIGRSVDPARAGN